MKNDKRVLLKVGLTVIISILIVLFGIAFLKDLKFGIDTNDLTVYFRNVNGLKEGDPVSVNGVPMGKVKTISLTTGDTVKVEFSLSKEVVLKVDYSVTVAMIEIMSGKQVAVTPGNSVEQADITKPLVGAKSNDVVSLIETMNGVGDQIMNITNKLDKTMDNLDVAVTNINSFASDEGLKANIRGTASNFNAASKNLSIMLADTRNNINSLTLKLNSIADNVDNSVTDTKPEVSRMLEDIRSLTARIDTVAINLNTLVLNAKDTSSTFGKLTGEDEIYNNLNKTIVSINKLVRKIEKDGIRLRLF